MPSFLPAPRLEAIAATVATRLSARVSGVFRQIGAQRSRVYAGAAVAALQADIDAGAITAMRPMIQTLVEELFELGLTFSDLRAFAQSLRAAVVEALTSSDLDYETRQRIGVWFFELVLTASMRFMARREEAMQTQAAARELERVESQLAELQAALDEKTRLLEVIRQASTPVAPVVRGILVVPLVGVFDTIRAEYLTEKLLQEVVRSRSRTVILDIAGVPMFDSDAAQLIIRLTRSVRLIGSKLYLVGMSPSTAATIVKLGIDLDDLETFATLQDGLAQALSQQRLRIVRF